MARWDRSRRVGTLAGTLVIRRVTGKLSRETLIAAGMGVVGMCILMLAAFPAIVATMIAAAGIGLGASIAIGRALSAVLQERTPAELRGRVSSVSTSMMSAAQAGAILVGRKWRRIHCRVRRARGSRRLRTERGHAAAHNRFTLYFRRGTY